MAKSPGRNAWVNAGKGKAMGNIHSKYAPVCLLQRFA